jgi:hypothetical protein
MPARTYHLPLREQKLFDNPNDTWAYLNDEGRMINGANYSWFADDWELRVGYCPLPSNDEDDE